MPAKTLESRKKAQTKWREAHREQLRVYNAKRYRANRDRIVAVNNAWRDAHPEAVRAVELKKKAKRRARAALHPFKVSAAGLAAKWEYWGGRCWMCSKPAEGWDHVKPLAKFGLHCLANLRPACATCNSSKGAKWPYCTVPGDPKEIRT